MTLLQSFVSPRLLFSHPSLVLQALVAETVARQEKDLGFKFDDADVKETEKILRNK
jgi:hypothetical protein